MISIITGLDGSGKSYYLTKVLLDKLENTDKQIWVDYPVLVENDRINYFTEFEQLLDVKNAEIFMDEGYRHLNSRKWNSLPESFQNKIFTHRHDGLNIHASAPTMRTLLIDLRDFVSHLYFTKLVFEIPESMSKVPLKIRQNLGLFVVREYSIDEQGKPEDKRGIQSTQFIWKKEKVCKSYDTKLDFEEFYKKHKKETDQDNFYYQKMFKCPCCGRSKMIL